MNCSSRAIFMPAMSNKHILNQLSFEYTRINAQKESREDMVAGLIHEDLRTAVLITMLLIIFHIGSTFARTEGDMVYPV